MLPRFAVLLLALPGAFTPFAHAEEGAPASAPAVSQMIETEIDGQTVVIEAEQLRVNQNQSMEAQGKVEVRQGTQKINADHLIYQQETRDVKAQGSVCIQQPSGTMTGPNLEMNLDSSIGRMDQPQFKITGTTARGSADLMLRTGKKTYSFDHGSFTTCPAGNNDWLLKMARLEIDRNTEIGVARHAHIEFMGVPILYTPWMDFPLNDSRKSGFLGPVIGSTNKGGNELTLPFYWNIAPNYDATLAPRLISKRGLMLNNEFRYLGSGYKGEANYDVLPSDQVSNQTRTRVALKHQQSLGEGLAASLQLNRVSDHDYFRDLASTVSGTAQTNLLNEGLLSYTGGWWVASARVQQFQTLQDPLALIVEPYRRAPQLNLAAQKVVGSGTATLQTEYVDFRHPSKLNGQRTVIYPTISYPVLNDQAYYITPKLGLHSTRYVMGDNNTGSLPDANRLIPIVSVDGGMVLERDFQARGVDYVQTLEPRAYYVKIPYRDQTALPNFDSAQAVFNFAQMFTENRFFGSDRIGDADMATLALTSRFFENIGGTERLRIALGERFSFIEPQVNLVAQNGVTNRSDILLNIGGRLSRALDLDSLYQYNPNQARGEVFNAIARYHPEKGQVINLGYRYSRDLLQNIDVSSQWPLTNRWYGVARWSYSMQNHLVLEALGGLEYNQDCWMLRFVMQRFATAANVTSTSVFMQLELNDLIRVGADPLAALKSSIPGYTKINESSFDKPLPGLR